LKKSLNVLENIKRSLDVAKGGLSGMWKGAKEALKKGKEEQQ